MHDPDTGLLCFLAIARHYGDYISPQEVIREQRTVGRALDDTDMLLAGKRINMRGRRRRLSREQLTKQAKLGPVIMQLRDGRFGLFAGRDGRSFHIEVPGEAELLTCTPRQLRKIWRGRVLVLTPMHGELDDSNRFGLRWFRKELAHHPWAVTRILLFSALLIVLGLIPPLAFQYVINEVLPNQAFNTLLIIATALALTYAFDPFLTWLRQYTTAHVGMQLDLILGSRLYEHLLGLPLGYFEARQVGVTIARVRENEQVRQFLTGPMLTLPLDLVSVIVILCIMPFYSVTLTLWVTVSLVAYALISALATPVLYRRLEAAFAANAASQSFLVESVTGVATIKSMAAEPQAQTRFEDHHSEHVWRSFHLMEFGNKVHQLIRFVQLATSGVILIAGAHLVIDEHLSVGELVAFTMFAGRLAEPILRLAQVWPEYQRTRVALARLADIFEHATERTHRVGATLPDALEGSITFKSCSFRYHADQPRPILDQVDIDIQAGEIIGVVGSSGSGKSTLAKLVQGLYLPSDGQVFLDGRDVAGLPTGWLRSQIGVVLQENYLFRASIRDNITFNRGEFSSDAVIAAAKLAGAHDFIADLPGDYDMILEERGANLSGGQRQRIAIARALITNPKILIFDEAMSALDAETEHAIQQNLSAMLAERTTLIISHRVAAIRDATRILAVENGRIVEEGTHAELLLRGGRYAEFYKLQNPGFKHA